MSNAHTARLITFHSEQKIVIDGKSYEWVIYLKCPITTALALNDLFYSVDIFLCYFNIHDFVLKKSFDSHWHNQMYSFFLLTNSRTAFYRFFLNWLNLKKGINCLEFQINILADHRVLNRTPSDLFVQLCWAELIRWTHYEIIIVRFSFLIEYTAWRSLNSRWRYNAMWQTVCDKRQITRASICYRDTSFLIKSFQRRLNWIELE